MGEAGTTPGPSSLGLCAPLTGQLVSLTAGCRAELQSQEEMGHCTVCRAIESDGSGAKSILTAGCGLSESRPRSVHLSSFWDMVSTNE